MRCTTLIGSEFSTRIDNQIFSYCNPRVAYFYFYPILIFHPIISTGSYQKSLTQTEVEKAARAVSNYTDVEQSFGFPNLKNFG